MKITAGLSAFLHVAVILIAWLGIPSARPMLAPVASIEVEIVADDIVKKSPPKPTKRPPPKQVARTPEPEAKPVKDDEAVAIPDVKKKPAPKPKPKPVVAKKKPEPPKKTRPRPKVKPKPKNKAKPKPKDDFASVLKTVEKLKPRPVAQKVENKKKKDETLAQIAQVLKRKPETRRRRIGEKVSSSELDLVHRQIVPCWSLPAGARGAEDMVVVIRTVVNPDGRVRTAQIVDSGFQMSDPFYRSMAESARRAVLNPRCQPFRLPPAKYNEWQVMVLTFHPGEMF